MRKITLLLSGFLLIVITVNAQELEPRGLTNLPLGTNFMVGGYAFAGGNILFDPALPIEDTKAQIHAFVGAYVRSINFFGMSGKVDALLSYGIGDWEGIYTGIDTTTARSGMSDLRVRFSFNFLGAPALKTEEFAGYEPESISGFSIQVIAPTGQYFPDRLINLGSNRWTFKPQWGFSRFHDMWIFEANLNTQFFTKNTDFLVGNELSQKPLMAIKAHGIRRLPHNMWAALSIGYAFGGQVFVNNKPRDTRVSSIRIGLNYAVPVGEHHTLRILWFSGIRLEQGADFDSISILYQYRWNNKG